MPPTQCPQCGDRVAAGSDFCANGHYLGWDSTLVGRPPVPGPVQPPGPPGSPAPPGPYGQQQQYALGPPPPTWQGPNTPLPPQEAQAQRQAVREDVAANPLPAGPSITCQNCGEINAQSRTYCQRCGEKLTMQPQPVQYLPPPPQPETRFPAKIVVTVVLALALIVAGVVFALSKSGGKDPVSGASSPPKVTVEATSQTTANPTTPPPSTQATQQNQQRVKVDRSTMTATASSELPPNQQLGRDYGVKNVLDGNANTAWNSDGEKVGTGVGQTLTFRFARPTHLVRLDFINGYARNRTLFKENGRIRGVQIVTDGGTFNTELADRDIVQSIEHDYGTTTQVTIKVTSIYPGTTYPDLALTEAGFVELR